MKFCYANSGRAASHTCGVLIEVVEVEHIAIKVCEDMFLIEVLLAVQRELLTADGAFLPVRLHVALETALLKVRWENHFT